MKRRGRAPMDWLGPPDLFGLPEGTALLVDPGPGRPRVTGRLLAYSAGVLSLCGLGGQRRDVERFVRARVLDGLLEPGDPVVRVGVPAAAWRGGVVRSSGRQVLVEVIGGELLWFTEDEIDSALSPRALAVSL